MERETRQEKAVNSLFSEAKRHLQCGCPNCAPQGKMELSLVMSYRLKRLVYEDEVSAVIGDLRQINATKREQVVFSKTDTV